MTKLLCILDGWGHREEVSYNAIKNANTPVWDRMLEEYSHSLLETSGEAVGLPKGQMGNSEVGHMNIGSGRIMMQTLPRINDSIVNDSLKKLPEFLKFIEDLKKSQGACHLLGMLSDGGVHSHQEHIIYLAKELAAQGILVHLHIILDGRDTSPNSAISYLENLIAEITDNSLIKISTLGGRYYAMDRDNNWDRVSLAYNEIADAKNKIFSEAITYVNDSYSKKNSDEFILPASNIEYQGIEDGDGFFIANFRADRARGLIASFLDKGFSGFEREKKDFSAKLGMVEYSKNINEYLPCLFPSYIPENTLSDVLEQHSLKQLHIAETEKYAHVTFFFNGGEEKEKIGEKRILIDSPAVATYDLKPEMSAPELTKELVNAILSKRYDFIVVNFANPDMVGHSGVWKAALKAVEQIDESLGILEESILKTDSEMLVTADHGNIEDMFDIAKGQAHTAHTINPVPLVLVSKNKRDLKSGKLCDIAPTILNLMNVEVPVEMTGVSLIEFV